MLRGYLELLRPANVVTAVADVLAGYAVAGRANTRALPWLLTATVCLYAGGLVLNDFSDRGLDAVERPERPIPSGRVPAPGAAALGAALLAAGVVAAAQGTLAAAALAATIVVLVVLYDARVKRLNTKLAHAEHPLSSMNRKNNPISGISFGIASAGRTSSHRPEKRAVRVLTHRIWFFPREPASGHICRT